MIYDTTEIDKIDESNSFTQKYIALFLKELRTLIPSLQNILVTKDTQALFQAIHKIKPTVHLLKIQSITTEVDHINALQEYTWNEDIEAKALKITQHLKEVENQMKVV